MFNNENKEKIKIDSQWVKWILIIIALVVLGLLLKTIVSKILDKGDDDGQIVRKVFVISPEKEDFIVSETFSSYIESESMVPVVSYLDGEIKELLVESGSYVEKDSEIAVVDDERYRLTQQQAEAAKQMAENTFKRVESLFASGGVSQQKYDEAKAQYDSYNAQYEASLLQTSYTRIKAPVAGTVLTTMVKVGETVGPGSPVAIIGDLNRLQATVAVSEKMLGKFAVGMDCVIESKVSNDIISGKVKAIEPFIDPQTKTFKVKVEVNKPDESIKAYFVPGSAVRVSIILKEMKNAYLIPKRCFTPDKNLYIVDNNKAEMIEASHFENNSQYIVVPAEYQRESFVIKGQANLFDDVSVNPETYREI